MDRRTALRWLGSGALATLASCQSLGGQPRAERPNVLFLVVDDLRPQLGCYGHSAMHTPHIDRLAAGGSAFQRAYCQVPVCGPSRISVLTGLRVGPGVWRCRDLRRPCITLPGLFKRHGYHTLSNGKVLHHLHDRAEDWSEAPWRSVPIYHGKGDWARYNTQGLWRNPDSAALKNARTGRGPYCEAAAVADDAYQDGRVAERTIADLRRLKATGKPFFLACGFWRPHLPFNAPKRYWDLYDRERIELAPNRFRPEGLPRQCRTSREIDRYGRTGSRKKEESFHREARHAYNACVSYVDAQIGRVLAALAALDLERDTVVVLWGDHGWHLGEHGFWGKHNTLHNALHTPLVIRAPGRPAGGSPRGLVELIDIYPTLCELTGLPVPEHVQGRSLIPQLGRPDHPGKRAVFSRWHGCRAVKTDRHLYTEWRKNGKVQARMLFDHREDPQENVNLAARSGREALVEALGRLLAPSWK